MNKSGKLIKYKKLKEKILESVLFFTKENLIYPNYSQLNL